MYYYYYAAPIIAIFISFLIFFGIWACVKASRQRRHPSVVEVQTIAFPVAEDILHRQPETNPENVYVNVHTDRCIYKDNNIPYWRLNCGGLVCNSCILNVLHSLRNKEEILCKECGVPIKNFDYIKLSNKAKVSSTSQQGQEELCEMCKEIKAEKTFNCEAFKRHQLCNGCFEELMNVNKLTLCPFCKDNVMMET